MLRLSVPLQVAVLGERYVTQQAEELRHYLLIVGSVPWFVCITAQARSEAFNVCLLDLSRAFNV
jgi:hypothetical protein